MGMGKETGRGGDMYGAALVKRGVDEYVEKDDEERYEGTLGMGGNWNGRRLENRELELNKDGGK